MGLLTTDPRRSPARSRSSTRRGLDAHVALDGNPAIGPGDRVRVHGDPIRVRSARRSAAPRRDPDPRRPLLRAGRASLAISAWPNSTKSASPGGACDRHARSPSRPPAAARRRPRQPRHRHFGMATEDTVLSPRFYTTDFAAMDASTSTGPRRMGLADRRDARPTRNKRHFRRTPEFDGVLDSLEPELRKEFIDFLVSSMTSEFSGCILYAEIAKRVTNPDIREPVQADEPRRGAPCRLPQRHAQGRRHRRRPRLPDQDQEIHLFPPEVHLLRGLSVGKDRLCALYHDLPSPRAAPRAPLPPDLQVLRAMVQRRVPPRRRVRAADARRPQAADRLQPLLGPLLPRLGLRDDVCPRPWPPGVPPGARRRHRRL